MGTRRHSELDEGHLGIEELASMLEQGLGEESRARVLSHLGAGCPVCGETLRALVGEPEEEAAATDDLVTLTLRDWLKYQRLPENRLSDLPPLYGHWLGRESFAPLEFYRAVLERGRTLAVEAPDQALEVLQELLHGLDNSRFADSEGPVIADLRGLGLVVLARAHLERLDHVTCEELLKRAKKELRKGSGDRQIAALLFETWADLAQAQGEHALAWARLKKAERLLKDCDVPQRYSEALAHRGIALIQSGFPAEGLNVLDRAYDSLPEAHYPRIRLEIRHFQAIAAVELRKYEEALRYLVGASGLYEIYKFLEPIATQRLWLLGFIHLASGRREKAEEHLRKALKRYNELRLMDGAVHAMTGLVVLYADRNDRQAIIDLFEEYSHVLGSAPKAKLVMTGLHIALQLARALGLSVPLLEKEIEWFEIGQQKAAVAPN